MLIPVIESIVYACAASFARVPSRVRRTPGRVVRVVSKESADRLVDALSAERQRTAALEAEIADLHEELAAAYRVFARRGLI